MVFILAVSYHLDTRYILEFFFPLYPLLHSTWLSSSSFSSASQEREGYDQLLFFMLIFALSFFVVLDYEYCLDADLFSLSVLFWKIFFWILFLIVYFKTIDSNSTYDHNISSFLLSYSNWEIWSQMTICTQERKTTVYSKEQRKENKGRFQVAFTCVVLLGLTWLFGVFAVGGGKTSYAFQLLFCIFNVFQGETKSAS